jgi:hypothetical protein
MNNILKEDMIITMLIAIGAFIMVLRIILFFSEGKESKTAPAPAEGKTATAEACFEKSVCAEEDTGTVKPDMPEVDPAGKWTPLFSNAYMSGCFNGSNLEFCQCKLDYIMEYNDIEKILKMTEAEQNDIVTPAVLHCAGTL